MRGALHVRTLFGGLVVALFFFTCLAPAARAGISISFYSQELGENFPHAFVVIDNNGTSESYGFTAARLSPAILAGPVEGIMRSETPRVIAKGEKHFSVIVSPQQYQGVMTIVATWRNTGGKDYDLNTRNCVTFVGVLAQSLGLKINPASKLMKKPRKYLEEVMALNPGLERSRKQKTPPAAPPAAAAEADSLY